MAEPVVLEVNQWTKVEWKIKHIFSDSFLKQRFRLMDGICGLCFSHSGRTCTKFWEDITIAIDMIELDPKYSKFRIRCFIEDKEKRPQFPFEIIHDFKENWYRGAIWATRTKDIRKRRDKLETKNVVTFVLMFTPVETLKSKCEIEHRSTETFPPLDPVLSMKSFSLDLRRLLDDRTHSDIILKCGGRTIAAHRAILSARSEVFSAMLRSDMSESRDGVISIIDIDGSVLEHLVVYIYSGIIPDLSDSTAQQLYKAADKYAVGSLRTQCSDFMKENLTKENACSILVLADAHFDVNLKESAISFILSSQLLLDGTWDKLIRDHPLLAKETAEAAMRASEQPGSSK